MFLGQDWFGSRDSFGLDRTRELRFLSSGQLARWRAVEEGWPLSSGDLVVLIALRQALPRKGKSVFFF